MKKFNLIWYVFLFTSIILFSCTDKKSEPDDPIDQEAPPVVPNPVTTVNITTAGTLQTSLTQAQIDTVTKFKLTGTIDARDFNTLKSMTLLSVLDLSEASIVAYSSFVNNEIPNDILGYKTSLTSVILPTSLKSIGSDAFENCTKLTSVTFPNGLTTIDARAFKGCKGLTSITIPTTVTLIDEYAFDGCTGLTSLAIPSSITSIKVGCFERCTGLTTVTLPSTLTSICGCAFNGCSNLTTVTIPSGVTFLGNYCFQSCNSLTSINIPRWVSTIGDNVFNYCVSLTSIYAYPTTPFNFVSSNVFGNVNKTTCILYVPSGSKTLYQAAAQWSDFTNIVEM